MFCKCLFRHDVVKVFVSFLVLVFVRAILVMLTIDFSVLFAPKERISPFRYFISFSFWRSAALFLPRFPLGLTKVAAQTFRDMYGDRVCSVFNI